MTYLQRPTPEHFRDWLTRNDDHGLPRRYDLFLRSVAAGDGYVYVTIGKGAGSGPGIIWKTPGGIYMPGGGTTFVTIAGGTSASALFHCTFDKQPGTTFFSGTDPNAMGRLLLLEGWEYMGEGRFRLHVDHSDRGAELRGLNDSMARSGEGRIPTWLKVLGMGAGAAAFWASARHNSSLPVVDATDSEER